MRKTLIVLASLLAVSYAKAADSTVAAMSAAAALDGTELYYVVQGGADRKATGAQINTYVRSLMGTGVSTWLNTPSSANLAAAVTDETGTGALVFATSPVLVTPALGTPTALVCTNCTGTAAGLTAGTVTTNANLTGMVTSVGNAAVLGSFTSANLSTALTNETGTGVAVFGTAPTIDSLNATTAMTLAFLAGGGTQCVTVSNTGVVGAAACGGTGANPTATAGPTAVNGVATTFMRSDGAPAVQQGSNSIKGIVQVDGTTITAASGVISAAPVSAVPSVQTGTNYPIVDGDRAKVIYLSNASAQTPTLPSAATLTSSNGWFVTICNIAAGIQTVTPTTSTIGGNASLPIPGGSAIRPVCWNAVSDGTNYRLVPAGNNNTIASGTSALGTSAIGSAACATVVTTSAPGTVTTDVVLASFNGDPTAVTGYIPLTAGMLTIIGYPSADNVNYKVCNNTTSSITPGAITLNWRVIR